MIFEEFEDNFQYDMDIDMLDFEDDNLIDEYLDALDAFDGIDSNEFNFDMDDILDYETTTEQEGHQAPQIKTKGTSR